MRRIFARFMASERLFARRSVHRFRFGANIDGPALMFRYFAITIEVRPWA